MAAVAVPLALNPWGANAFELPKGIVLRLIALLMGLATLAQIIEPRGSPPRTRHPPRSLLGPTLALGLALTWATLGSVNPRASLWGSYERQQGLITWAAYLIILTFTATGIETRAQFDRLWTALIWTSAPVVAYGLLQAAGVDPLNWRSDAASPVLSTVGRANFLGSYLVLLAPLTLGRALTAERRGPPLALLAAQLTGLALTQARGAWVGLGAAATTFGLAWGLHRRERRVIIATGAAAALAVGCVALLNLPGGPLAPLAALPGLDRLAALGHTEAGSTAARLTIWRATRPLIAARPGLGYGPETLRVVFAGVFPPELVYYQGRHAVVDRAHNLWLDLALSAGLAGVLAFAALLGGGGHLAWRGIRARNDRRWGITWAALAAAVAGHLVDLQFGFDLTASATVLWLVVGLAGALGRGLRERPPTRTRVENPLLLLPPTLAALTLAWMVCARPLLADTAFWRAQQAPRPPEARRAAAEEAVRRWPLEPVYRLGLARRCAEGGAFSAAEEQLAIAARLSPGDPRVWSARGDLYAAWATVEPERYRDAEAAYRHVLALAPNVATYHATLGVTLARQGRLGEGIAALERAVALDATDGVAYAHLAELYTAVGRDEAAAWARGEAARWPGEVP